MDRALDDIIGDRPRDSRPRGSRGGRGERPPTAPRDYDAGPRDGVKKVHFPRQSRTATHRQQYDQRDAPRNLDKDWVHDRWTEDDEDPRRSDRREQRDRYSPSPDRRRQPPSDAKLRIENVHYELAEPDLRELFSRIGPLSTVQILYDRHDRPTGTAFVTYHSLANARQAVADFDGANAYGQPIRVTLLPPQATSRNNPFDGVERPSRSLFDRIDGREQGRRPRTRRSESPERVRGQEIDRYVPAGRRDRERSPVQRRGTPREGGHRSGQRSERGGAARRGEGERPGRRPKKTAEELDAEMNDYWGKGAAADGDEANDKPDPAAEGEIDIMVD